MFATDESLIMALSRTEVLQIATLARIALTDEEVELFREQLSEILDQFEALKELDTSGVPPTGHAVDLQAVMRGRRGAGLLGRGGSAP